MLKTVSQKTLLSMLSLGLLATLSGCSKDTLVMKAYTPPKKQQEVKEMLASNDNANGFLNIELVDDIDYITNKSKNADEIAAAKKLLESVKQYITKTDFISLSSIGDESAVGLDMQIIKFNYDETEGGGLAKLNAFIEVTFNIRKDSTVFYTQTYKKVIKRQTKGGKQALPSKDEILSQAAEYLAKKLVKDISPLPTRKLVTLEDLPDDVAFASKLAKKGDFEAAINALEKYIKKQEKAKEDIEYPVWFDLAVFYEGLAASEADYGLLTKANAYYEKAFELGGSDDDIVVKGKSQFDKFYKIVKKVAEQKVKNNKANEDNKYELLD